GVGLVLRTDLPRADQVRLSAAPKMKRPVRTARLAVYPHVHRDTGVDGSGETDGATRACVEPDVDIAVGPRIDEIRPAVAIHVGEECPGGGRHGYPGRCSHERAIP